MRRGVKQNYGRIDTRLTLDGEAGARQAAAFVKKLDPKPELLVVSPLTRALRTATLAFEGAQHGRALGHLSVRAGGDVEAALHGASPNPLPQAPLLESDHASCNLPLSSNPCLPSLRRTTTNG